MAFKVGNFPFIKGSDRSTTVKRNILGSFLVKGLSVIISLLYVPMTLNYLNPTRYGIWMTLTSIVAWMTVFDIGLGNGMRNKLAEALATEDYAKAKKYVSTTYAILIIIVLVVLLLFCIVNYWINWSFVLNTDLSYSNELKELVIIVVPLFGIKFVLNIITIIPTANQNPVLGNSFELIGNVGGLLSVWILTLTHKTSLITFAWATMLTPVIIFFVISLFFYNTHYKYLKPTWKSVDLTYAKDLTGLGVKFFVIQIAGLIIFQTSNILISQFFTPAEVTPYNIVFKYYSILTMVWGTVMLPLWSAFTHASALNDTDWIKKTINKLNKSMIAIVIIILVMSFAAQNIIAFWTLEKVHATSQLVWILALYTLISIWNTLYSVFLNGISVTRIQVYTSITAAILNIPFAFVFVNYFHMGSEGVVLAMSISLSFFAILGPIESFKILRTWKKI